MKNLFKIREMLREIRITKESNLPWSDIFLARTDDSIEHNLHEYISMMLTLYDSFLLDKKICRCPLSFDAWLKGQRTGKCSGTKCFAKCPFRDANLVDTDEEVEEEVEEVCDED